MSYVAIWAAISIGSFAYHLGKLALGFSPNWSSTFDASFWSGWTLLIVHLHERAAS